MMIRGFEIVSPEFRKNSEEIIMPLRKTKFSAGYDFIVCKDVTIEPKSSYMFWSDIKAYMLDDEVLEMYIRSSLAINNNLRLSNFVPIIDKDYYNNSKNDGNIGISVYNDSVLPFNIKRGEAIAQGIFKKYLVADNCNSEEIRTGGIGSTNK